MAETRLEFLPLQARTVSGSTGFVSTITRRDGSAAVARARFILTVTAFAGGTGLSIECLSRTAAAGQYCVGLLPAKKLKIGVEHTCFDLMGEDISIEWTITGGSPSVTFGFEAILQF